MLLLPIEYVVYKTKLTEEEVIKRLENNTDQREIINFKFFSFPEKEFKGKVIGQVFKIQQTSFSRGFCLPVIIGVIENDSNQSTIIKVKMRLDIHDMIFTSFWCIFFLSMLLTAKIEENFGIPLNLLLFGYGLVLLSFKYESSCSIKDLKRIFEADIIKR